MSAVILINRFHIPNTVVYHSEKVRHVLMSARGALQIFYPPKMLPDGTTPNPLRDPKKNMWLTTCGIAQAPQGPSSCAACAVAAAHLLGGSTLGQELCCRDMHAVRIHAA